MQQQEGARGMGGGRVGIILLAISLLFFIVLKFLEIQISAPGEVHSK